MTRSVLLLSAILASTAQLGVSETLVASHTLRSRSMISAADLAVIPETVTGALKDPADAIGLEARVMLYAGRPIRPDDLGPPARIERNEVVMLLYRQGPLSITAEGRSLARAAVGESARAMNLESRATVTGTVDPHGRILVDSPISGR